VNVVDQRGQPTAWPSQTEVFKRFHVQPITTQTVCCVGKSHGVWTCAVSALCPISFSYFSVNNTGHSFSPTGHESVDQGSHVPIAFTAAVMNDNGIYSLQKTLLNPLSCPGLTPYNKACDFPEPNPGCSIPPTACTTCEWSQTVRHQTPSTLLAELMTISEPWPIEWTSLKCLTTQLQIWVPLMTESIP